VATVVVGARREKSRRHRAAAAPGKEDSSVAAIVLFWLWLQCWDEEKLAIYARAMFNLIGNFFWSQ
jgi:hypothetical protein